MTTLLPIVVTFLLSGLFGNHLLQKWQARNWLLQQRFLGHEKEYAALKELMDEIATLLGVRIFQMQRLNWSLATGNVAKTTLRLQEYDDTLKRWNERLTSFYVRLPMLANTGFAMRLEQSIQQALAVTGRKIERAASSQLGNSVVPKQLTAEIEKELATIQGRAISFNKALLDYVDSKRSKVYFGTRIQLSAGTISEFSTWHLIKALFVRDVNSVSIVRTSLDP
jgi:hypothetical protein